MVGNLLSGAELSSKDTTGQRLSGQRSNTPFFRQRQECGFRRSINQVVSYLEHFNEIVLYQVAPFLRRVHGDCDVLDLALLLKAIQWFYPFLGFELIQTGTVDLVDVNH